VGDPDATFDEAPADKQAAMAGERLVLAAHQRKPGAGRDLLDVGDALGE
jgi:hypothetical protein